MGNKNDKPTCVVYIRRSSIRSDKQRNTLEEQTYWAVEYLHSRPDITLLDIDGRPVPGEKMESAFVIESSSAGSEKKERPLFRKLMRTIERQGVDYLITWEIDRLSRNLEDSQKILSLIAGKTPQIRCAIVSDDAEYAASDYPSLMDRLSQAGRYNQSQSKRAKQSHSHQRLKGFFASKFPFGYKNAVIDDHGKRGVKVVEAEAKMVRTAFQMRFEGHTCVQIAKFFSDNGFPKQSQFIGDLLRQPIYYGEFFPAGSENPIHIRNDGFRAIISKAEFQKVNRILVENKKRQGEAVDASYSKRRLLFSKMVFDAGGRPLQGEVKKGKTYYREQAKGFSYRINIAEEILLDAGREAMEGFSLPEHFLTVAKMVLETGSKQKNQDVEEQKRSVKRELDMTLLDLGRLVRSLTGIENPVIRPFVEAEIADTGEKKKRLEEKLKSMEVDHARLLSDAILKPLETLGKRFPSLTDVEQAKYLRAFGFRFIVGPDKTVEVQRKIHPLLKS